MKNTDKIKRDFTYKKFNLKLDKVIKGHPSLKSLNCAFTCNWDFNKNMGHANFVHIDNTAINILLHPLGIDGFLGFMSDIPPTSIYLGDKQIIIYRVIFDYYPDTGKFVAFLILGDDGNSIIGSEKVDVQKLTRRVKEAQSALSKKRGSLVGLDLPNEGFHENDEIEPEGAEGLDEAIADLQIDDDFNDSLGEEINGLVGDALSNLSEAQREEFKLFIEEKANNPWVHEISDPSVDNVGVIPEDPDYPEELIFLNAREYIIQGLSAAPTEQQRLQMRDRLNIVLGILGDQGHSTALSFDVLQAIVGGIPPPPDGFSGANRSVLLRVKKPLPTIDIPVPLSERSKNILAKALVKLWSIPNEVFWKNMGIACNKIGLTPMGGFYFMNVTVGLYSNREVFIWEKFSDRIPYVEKLIGILKNEKKERKLPAFFSKVAEFNHNGKAMPRSVQASLARDAFALIYKEISDKNKLKLSKTKNTNFKPPSIIKSRHIDFLIMLTRINYQLNNDSNKIRPEEKEAKAKDIKLFTFPLFFNKAKAKDYWSDYVSHKTNLQAFEYPFSQINTLPVIDKDSKKELGKEDIKKIAHAINWFPATIDGLFFLKEDFRYKSVHIAKGIPLVFGEYKNSDFILLVDSLPLIDLVTISEVNNLELLSSNGSPYKRPADSGISGKISDMPLNEVLSLSGLLAFALPPPWGPIVATGLAFFQYLFGKSGTNPFVKIINQILNQIVKELKEIVEAEDNITLINNIEDFSKKFSVQLAVMQQDPSNIDYMIEEMIPLFNNALDPSLGASVYRSFQQIIGKKYYVPKKAKDQLGFATYKLVNSTVVTLSLIYKVKLQIYALAASHYHLKDSDKFNHYSNLWLGTFENWYIIMKGKKESKLVGLLDLLTNLRNNVNTARANAIKITHGPYPSVVFHYFQFSKPYHTYYKDPWTGISDTCTQYTSTLSPFMSGPDCDGNYKHERKSDIAAFNNALTKLVNIDEIVKQIDFSLREWSSHLKPIVPKINTIRVDFSKSKTKTPLGIWKSGAEVRYTVKFANSHGESEMPWGGYFKVTDKAFPTINIPIDGHELTTVRWIVRQFKGYIPQTIVAIRNNTDTTFVDNNLKGPGEIPLTPAKTIVKDHFKITLNKPVKDYKMPPQFKSLDCLFRYSMHSKKEDWVISLISMDGKHFGGPDGEKLVYDTFSKEIFSEKSIDFCVLYPIIPAKGPKNTNIVSISLSFLPDMKKVSVTLTFRESLLYFYAITSSYVDFVPT